MKINQITLNRLRNDANFQFHTYLLTALLCVFALPLSVFSQGLQLNTEETLMQKWSDYQSECAQISKMVPCAVGVADIKDKLPPAADKSERDARVKLALSVKAFVSYDSVDSSWIENEVAQELSKVVSKIKIEDLLLTNSQVLKKEYAKITNEKGETIYRVITLMALNSQYYKEAEAEVKKAEAELSASSSSAAESSSSTAVAAAAQTQSPKQNVLPVKASFKEKAKEIATKTASFLLNVAKKFLSGGAL